MTLGVVWGGHWCNGRDRWGLIRPIVGEVRQGERGVPGLEGGRGWGG